MGVTRPEAVPLLEDPRMIDFAESRPRSHTALAITPAKVTAAATPAALTVTSTSTVSSTATSTPLPPPDLERLGDEIAELAAHIHAATYRLLVLIREFDQREGWDGSFKTCAHWLSWRTGIAMGPARERVRVAHALEHLPGLSSRMRSGELSYSKARALTRVATRENEEELMEFARHGTASHVEKLVRAWRRVDRLQDEWQERERHRTSSLTLWRDGDGMYELRGRLDPEVGVMLMRAIEAARDALYRRSGKFERPKSPEDPEGSHDPDLTGEQIRADAIGLLAERALQGGGLESDGESIGRADRFQVIVHVDAEALAESEEPTEAPEPAESSQSVESPESSESRKSSVSPSWPSLRSLPPPSLSLSRSSPLPSSGGAMLQGDLRVPAGTSRRIACDASLVVMTHGPDGSVLDVGRKTRTVPPAIRRALDHRDGGCRFPGCGLRFCDAHHVKHWADGGETRLGNLVLLCRRHHRAVHEEGFRVEIVTDAEGGREKGGRDKGGRGKGGWDKGGRGGGGGRDPRRRQVIGGGARGSVRFYWPDGRSFPEVPPVPTLPGDPVAALESQHSRMGIWVDPETTTPYWNGERFDVGWAIHTLWRP
jgi:hypothetical protein